MEKKGRDRWSGFRERKQITRVKRTGQKTVLTQRTYLLFSGLFLVGVSVWHSEASGS